MFARLIAGLHALPVVVALVTVALPAGAAGQTVTARYDIRFLGVRLATADVESSLEPGRYRLRIGASYTVLVQSGHVAGEASGLIEQDQTRPVAYALAVTGSDPDRRARIEFEAGAARRITIDPPLEADWPQGRVPLEPRHQVGVLDPLSALVHLAVLAGREEAPCRGTLPVFTGVSRFDFTLSPWEGSGRSPAGLTCRVRFQAVAGHRPGNQTVRALTEATGMRIAFDAERVGSARLPVRFEVPTRYGTLVIERRRPND